MQTKLIAIAKQRFTGDLVQYQLEGTHSFELTAKLSDLEEMVQSIERYLPVNK